MIEEKVHFVVPTLHYWEFANVLRTNVRAKTIDASLARDIWTLHLDAPLELVEPSPEEVLNVAPENGTTAYDAVFIALATQLDIPFLTAERPTTPWVRQLGKRVQSILR